MLSAENNSLKTKLHPRNKNREAYDFEALVHCLPELKNYVRPNKYGAASIDFSAPLAVKALNKALLAHYYGIKNWHFPNKNLCPAIPGRADYLHYMADLLSANNFGKHPPGPKITCLDIGLGASCIYPILGVSEYNWNFIGSDINQASIDSAKKIVLANPSLRKKIECKLQKNTGNIFYGIIDRDMRLDLALCNPPFHSTAEAAQKGTHRKEKNLSGKTNQKTTQNFSGIQSELICDGGEYKFIRSMVKESKKFASNFFWFSTLVSKQSNLKGIYKALQKVSALQVKTIPMGTGNKVTRIVAWTFLSKEEQIKWRETRW